MKKAEVTLAFQNITFFRTPKGILMAALIIFLSIAGRRCCLATLLLYGRSTVGNTVPESGPELVNLVVLG